VEIVVKVVDVKIVVRVINVANVVLVIYKGCKCQKHFNISITTTATFIITAT
jgi:hypothetical protein